MTDVQQQAIAIKKAACKDWYRASFDAGLGLEVGEFGSATAFSCTGVDSLMLNRCLGLGALSFTEGDLQRAIEHYRQLDLEWFFIHVAPGPGRDAATRALAAAGLRPFHRDWVTLTRQLDPRGAALLAPRSTSFRVAALGPEHAQAAAAILGDAFDMPETSRALFANSVGRSGWHYFGAFDTEHLVATGAIYTEGESACLTFGATLREARGRGVQAALMAERLERARQLGCNLVVTETGVTVPGKPQHSYNNMLKNGFEPCFVVRNYGPPGLSW